MRDTPTVGKQALGLPWCLKVSSLGEGTREMEIQSVRHRAWLSRQAACPNLRFDPQHHITWVSWHLPLIRTLESKVGGS